MARKPLMAGNWKMHLNHLEAMHLVQDLAFRLTDADLEAVEGVGDARAKEIREGIRRLQEVDIVDRYR